MLSAFWLENWRKSAEDNDFKNQTLAELVAVIDSDLQNLEKIVSVQKRARESAELILSDVESRGKVLKYDSLSVHLIRASNGIITYYPQEGLFELINKSNVVTMIRSKDLRSLLFTLYDHDIERLKNLNLLIDESYLDYQESFERNGFHFGGGIELRSNQLPEKYYLDNDLVFSIRRIASWSGAYMERLNELKPRYLELKKLCLEELEE